MLKNFNKNLKNQFPSAILFYIMLCSDGSGVAGLNCKEWRLFYTTPDKKGEKTMIIRFFKNPLKFVLIVLIIGVFVLSCELPAYMLRHEITGVANTSTTTTTVTCDLTNIGYNDLYNVWMVVYLQLDGTFEEYLIPCGDLRIGENIVFDELLTHGSNNIAYARQAWVVGCGWDPN